MAAHVAWTAVLYALLTVLRAPTAWGIAARADGSNPWADWEQRVSANLSNQFEWPLFFHVACLLLMLNGGTPQSAALWLAWTFVAGRLLHSAVQVSTSGIRLRGVVFTINFLAVLAMWALLVPPFAD